ncbi:hypothetical protein TBLA_0B01540 [Henningerozyma blattae CBS 6284]|uniref:Ion transport domain-containing protein n=1 Tax=Henningerozyma blattae (strain ATCC 34711 / CBS 6284 / DSM 70876 / NBRC 10599 / NRRL Y-10934 / UCD 77-7) TaxID=1071380 RepID=I2GXZ5_HENB6|nr:hypothetical protein TBLA_0B01540 [Tetrapisispora blattae CBS 6284]CCH58997.1 hypothetical protein TBLA_0B01540 [Tetrapisispora blattae CBS 6284]
MSSHHGHHADPILPVNSSDVSITENYEEISFLPPNSRQVLRIALNLKYLIDKAIPIAYNEELVLCEHSRILNANVIRLTREACGGDPSDPHSLRKYESVLVFSLLKVANWYDDLSSQELHNSELYNLRSTVAQQLCKIIIEEEESENLYFMMLNMLLHRYTINENEVDSEPTNALELATDMHYTIVIGSSGFQRCLNWLWRGWIVQSRNDPTIFIKENSISSTLFSRHFTPERIKTPQYQNIIQLLFSVLFLLIYTIIVNTKTSDEIEPIDKIEAFLYFFTIGYILDEFFKFYYIGMAYLQFWNCFNDTLYLIIIVSMNLRIISIYWPMSPDSTYDNKQLDVISYRILACAAPFIWSRLLLYLESERFVGAMLVVLKHMMKESLIFFVLLGLIMIGFLQGFLGLDSADGKREITTSILSNLIITVLGSGSFDETFDNFAPPYAGILYYGYCFIVTTILLNILIALYSNAYQKVSDNSDDEYMALMSQKILRFIRAPDENVFVPPLNLIELFISKPVMKILMVPDQWYKNLTNFIMVIIYSPFLFYISIKEIKIAKRVQYNRIKKLPDDANEIDVAWDLTDGYLDNDSSLIGLAEESMASTSNSTTDVTENGATITRVSHAEESIIQATNLRNNIAIKIQREAEAADPKFGINKTKWYKGINKAIQPVEKGYENGWGWENYKLYESLEAKNKVTEKKIDELNKTIVQLTELIKELKIKKE